MSGKPKPKPGVNANKGPKGPANRPRNETRASSKQAPAENQYMSQEFQDEYNKRGSFIETCIERLKYYGEDEAKLRKAYQDKSDLPPPNPNGAALTGSKSPRGAFIELLIERLANYGEDEEMLRKAYQENNHLPPPNPHNAASVRSKSADKDKEIRCLTERNQELLKKMEKMEREKHSTSATRQSSGKTDYQDENEDDTKTLKENVQKCQDELKKKRDELEERKIEMETLKRENEELKTKSNKQKKEQDENVTTYELKIEDSEKTNADLMEENKALESKVKELEQFKKDVTENMQNRQKEMEEKQLQRQKTEISKDRVSSGKQKENLAALQKENATLKEENKKKTEDAEDMKRKYQDLKQENEKKTTDVEKLKRQCSDLKIEREKVTEEMNQLRKDISQNEKKSEMDMKKLQIENAKLIAKSEETKREIDQLKKEKEDQINFSQEKNKRGGKADKSSPEETISKLRDEVEGLRNRLSKMAGAQLTDNNPAIADLSDPNRPLSLGEKFSELYDNEWTDAMEELSDTISDEKIVIKHLLSIVCDAYQFCLIKSDEFMDKINGTLSGFSEDLGSSDVMPKEVAKTNKDYRKSLAVYVVSYLQQDFAKVEKAKSKSPVGKATESYMKKCVSVCWFMTVQDPKVCITTDPPDVFDEDQYKPYTKKGKHMDYLVWPVLHLHKGGPLIGKGVAQGKP